MKVLLLVMYVPISNFKVVHSFLFFISLLLLLEVTKLIIR